MFRLKLIIILNKMIRVFAHIFENFSGAVCCLNECLVVVKGKLLCGIEDQSAFLLQMLWF